MKKVKIPRIFRIHYTRPKTEKQMTGWIRIHRILMSKPIWLQSTPEQKVILITLLMMANHTEKEWIWKGKKFKAKPGQFVTSLDAITSRCGYGITKQNVRTALDKLQKLEFLIDESTKNGRLVTIVNWASYQITDELYASKSLQDSVSEEHSKSNIAANIVANIPQSLTSKVLEHVSQHSNQHSNQHRANIELTPNNNNKNDNKDIDISDWLQKKKDVFRKMVKPYVEKYGRDICNDFFAYWTQPHKRLKQIKWEGEKYFDVDARLRTFKRNENEKARR